MRTKKQHNTRLKAKRLIIGTDSVQEWDITYHRFLHNIDTAINEYLKRHEDDYSLDGFIKWSNKRWAMIQIEKVVT